MSPRIMIAIAALLAVTACKSGSTDESGKTTTAAQESSPEQQEPEGTPSETKTDDAPELPKLGDQVKERIGSSKHLIVTTTPSWSAPAGELVLYERGDDGWSKALGPMPANVGENGMGWGRGLTQQPAEADAPTKVEGDGKATAGIFEVGMAYGYADAPPEGVTIPYEKLTKQTYCVYDTKAERYNQVFDWPADKEKSWEKAETMRRDDDQYSLLLTIRHNELNGEPADIEPGAGSCIFLHVWSGEEQPTVGCTSVEGEELVKLLAEIDAPEQTLFVQFPRPVYQRLARQLDLPF